jgi:hypothetical protein
MMLNTTTGSPSAKPGRIWWFMEPYAGMNPFLVDIVPQYDPGVHLLPGYHLFGAFQITERRFIQKSLLEMMGFNPV